VAFASLLRVPAILAPSVSLSRDNRHESRRAPTVDRGLDWESNAWPGSIVWHATADGAECSIVQTVLRVCSATGRGPATYCRSHGWVTLNYDPVPSSQP
jgi:hypothetical protein